MANHVTNKLRFAGKESKVKEMPIAFAVLE